MPYSSSKVTNKQGTTVGIDTSGGSGGPTYTVIGEITDWSVSGDGWSTLDSTNVQSTREEWIFNLKTAATLKLDGNLVHGDAGMTQVETDFAAGVTDRKFQIMFPMESGQTTSGDSIVVTGGIESRDWSGGSKKATTFSLSIKTSADPDFVAGV